jgi:hypothetical protein
LASVRKIVAVSAPPSRQSPHREAYRVSGPPEQSPNLTPTHKRPDPASLTYRPAITVKNRRPRRDAPAHRNGSPWRDRSPRGTGGHAGPRLLPRPPATSERRPPTWTRAALAVEAPYWRASSRRHFQRAFLLFCFQLWWRCITRTLLPPW